MSDRAGRGGRCGRIETEADLRGALVGGCGDRGREDGTKHGLGGLCDGEGLARRDTVVARHDGEASRSGEAGSSAGCGAFPANFWRGAAGGRGGRRRSVAESEFAGAARGVGGAGARGGNGAGGGRGAEAGNAVVSEPSRCGGRAAQLRGDDMDAPAMADMERVKAGGGAGRHPSYSRNFVYDAACVVLVIRPQTMTELIYSPDGVV